MSKCVDELFYSIDKMEAAMRDRRTRPCTPREWRRAERDLADLYRELEIEKVKEERERDLYEYRMAVAEAMRPDEDWTP